MEEEATVSEMESIEQKEVISEMETPTPEPDQGERIKLELEAYQRHFLALNEELAEIRKRYNVPEDTPPDPVAVLSGEVNSLKSGFDEIKQMILDQRTQQDQAQGQQQQMMFQQPFIQQAPQMQFIPQYQPMFQTSTIMPAPSLPYLATPPLIPTNTQVPQMNLNNNNRR